MFLHCLPCLSKIFRKFHIGEYKQTVDTVMTQISAELREISLKIHSHPELAFHEILASTLLENYMEAKGFRVVRGAFGLKTAFVCEWTNTVGNKEGPQIGFCSEYDALKNLGHACGHNLIAINGAAAAVATMSVLKKYKIQGSVYLYGTPAEEGGGGKIKMLQAGGFAHLDACLMSHPGPTESSMFRALYKQSLQVQFTGKPAHASASPWDGLNALDAVCLAFSFISTMRQQLPPNARVHGIITNGGSAANVIPDLTSARFTVRATSNKQLEDLIVKTVHCFEAAASATGCQVALNYSSRYSGFILNTTLSRIYQRLMEDYGISFPSEDEMLSTFPASTDFGDVTHVIPGLHPGYYVGIPNVGNHTQDFACAAATEEAHERTLLAAKGLALVAVTLLTDNAKLRAVKVEFAKRKSEEDDQRTEVVGWNVELDEDEFKILEQSEYGLKNILSRLTC